MTIQASYAQTGDQPNNQLEVKNFAKKIKINPSCTFGTKFVASALIDALVHAPSPEKVLEQNEKINYSITCINFDSANYEAKPFEILIDSNLDTNNALVYLSEKFSDYFEIAGNSPKK